MRKTIILLIAMGTSAWSAGFQILEQGASNVGTAMAGSTVNANNDASAAFWNPSAGFFTKKDRQMDVNINFIVPNFRLKDSKFSTNLPVRHGRGDGGNAGKVGIVPNIFTTWKINDKWLFSLSSTSTYGLATGYEVDFGAGQQGIGSKILTLDVNPSIAYKITDWWSVSAGISAQYLNAKLTSMMAGQPITVQGSSMGVGWNLGTTIQYAPGGRIGIAYRSQIQHHLKGELDVNDVKRDNIDGKITIPNTITVGIYQRGWGDFFKQFAIMGEYGWTSWSQFKQLRITGTGGSIVNSTVEEPHGVDENWMNSSRFAVGMHWYPQFVADDALVFRFGFAWDQSPVHHDNGTVRIPDTNRLWFAAGVGYTYKEFMTFNFGYSYIHMFDRAFNRTESKDVGAQIPLSNSASGNFVGRAHVLSASIGFSF